MSVRVSSIVDRQPTPPPLSSALDVSATSPSLPQNHTWDESETRDFDWNGYKHFGFDWNSTRDLTGLHATDAAYDLQLPKPRLKRLAISILVDDHYDAVRAECMEILRQLMAKMNEILQR